MRSTSTTARKPRRDRAAEYRAKDAEQLDCALGVRRWSCGYCTPADGWRFVYVDAVTRAEARAEAERQLTDPVTGCVRPVTGSIQPVDD